jgi:two-component sensor histidine kinase
MVAVSTCGLICLDRRGVVVDANAAASHLLRVERAGLVGRHVADLGLNLVQEDGAPLPLERAVIRQLLGGGGSVRPGATLGVHGPGGQMNWVSYTLTPMLAAAGGGVEGAVVTLTDITEQRTALGQLRASEARYRKLADANRRLLNEVNHRVRNNLASLLAMITLMRQRATTVQGFAEAVEARVMALVQSHGLLVEAHWGDVDLRTLVTRLLHSLQRIAPHNIEVQIDGPAVAVSARQTLPLAMTMWELFANSCKHGAHSQATGQLRVAWQVRRQDGQAIVELLWRERGGPAIAAEPVASLGLELIRGFVGHELGGHCVLRFPQPGVEHTLAFPMTPTPAAPAGPAS